MNAGEPTSSFETAQGASTPPHHVSLKEREHLQALLDRYGSIRLDADADYRSAKLETLVVPSGARIYGGWNTRVPQLVIRAGTSDVVIEHVRNDAPSSVDVLFSGHGPIENVRIIGGSGGPTTHVRVKADTGTRINRLSLSEFGGLEISQAFGGSVRNSVFQRLLGYWPGPQVVWEGNVVDPSSNNFFLGISAITPRFGSVWKDAGEIWLLGWDCETWDMQGDGDKTAFEFINATRIVSIGMSGGTSVPGRAGSLAVFRGVANLLSWYQHGHGGDLNAAADVELDHVTNAVFVEGEGVVRIRDQDPPPEAARAHLNDPNNIFPKAATADRGRAPFPRTTERALAGAFLAFEEHAPPKTGRMRPIRRELGEGNLLKQAPALGLPIIRDASRQIQAQVDASGMARLADGIYVLEQPLRLGSAHRPEGLFGADRHSVFLTTVRDIPLVTGRGGFGTGSIPGGPAVNLVLSGMTLFGGTHGILLRGDADNVGSAGLMAFSTLQDVRFAAQAIAGFWAEGIYGVDANFWHKVDFADMPIAMRGLGIGMGKGLTYCDKQHFLDCQFQRIADAVWYWTSDRSSGGHVWTDCYFEAVGCVSKTRSAVNLLWTNCVFEDVVGPVGLSILDGPSTASYYFYQIGCQWRGRGPSVVTDALAADMGPLFIDTDFGQALGSLVTTTGRGALSSWNSRISGSAQPGRVTDGVIVDSQLGSLGDGVLSLQAGQVTTVLTAHPNARQPRLPF